MTMIDAFRTAIHTPAVDTGRPCSVFWYHDRTGMLGFRLERDVLVTYISLAALEYAIDETRRAQTGVVTQGDASAS